MRTLFQSYTHRPAKRTLVVSMSVHGLVLGALVILPLISYAALPETRLVSYLRTPAPPDVPPPPVPPAPEIPPVSEPKKIEVGEMIIPIEVPAEIPPPEEEMLPSVLSPESAPGATTIGIPPGLTGTVAIPQGLQGAALPEPPRPKPVQAAAAAGRLRVSEGIVLSKVMRKVRPRYPPLAQRARVSGTVRLDITIDPLGNVIEVKVLQGPALLIQEAVDAVSQWKFSPTMLNDQPVQVKANINVVFRLN